MPLEPIDLDLEFLKTTARRAGDAILEVYGTEFAVDVKEDKSPLTEADRRSNEVIVAALTARYPEIPVISEETRTLPYDERKKWERFWLVDPLDGTKEFIKRNGEFTVNIALVEKGEPVAGVVFQPAADRLYWAARGQGAWLSVEGGAPESLSGGPHYRDADSVVVVASRSHLTDEVKDFVTSLETEGKSVEFHSSGSSLKLCLVAEGAAHVYPRLGPTMEWDTGAADAVAREAGKQVLNWETREPLAYNKEDLLNPWFVVE
ncbi:MAG: 3'(2'),5'-bisphosphate nucleotidase CysQ [Verrucomicrobiae bacterium]|nr:3'(2'),5'-bisphosphate nucleotidase CysQ [Verrucomicrobiae bacterium]